MVYTFNFEDNYYIYDTSRPALLKCDKAVSDYLAGRAEDISAADIPDIESELKELKEGGFLYAEERTEELAKSGELKALCIHVCHDCNLRCGYCFAGEGAFHGERSFMDFKTAKAAIDLLIKKSGKRKVLEADFFGGEPLMNMDTVKETVKYAREEGKKYNKEFLFTLTTNGVLLNDENIKFLNDEMENVVLSLDGRQEVHDRVRRTVNGKGSFELVLENLKRFVSSRGGKSYYVRGTFTNKNIDFKEDVLFLADSGFKNISLEPVVLEEEHPLAIKNEHLEDISKEYRSLTKEYLKRIEEGKDFNFFHFNVDIEGGPCDAKRISACGAGNEYLSVTPNGDIFPCHQFAGNPKFLMGNVLEGTFNESIKEIFKNSSLNTREKCGDCFAKYHCSGGCAANNYSFNGDIDKPYEITCGMMKERLTCALHILSERKV